MAQTVQTNEKITTSLTTIAHTYTFDIKFERFSDYTSNAVINSGIFTIPKPKSNWSLRVNPFYKNEDKCYIAVFLRLESNTIEVTAEFTLIIRDASGKEVQMRSTKQTFNVSNNIWGWREFLPMNTLETDRVKILGENDCLNICCIIKTFEEPIQVVGSSLSEDLDSLFKRKIHTDIVIESQDGVKIDAHSIILRARSDAFESMLESEMKEKSERRIVIKDFGSEVIKQMIHFLYTDKVENIEKNAIDLVYIADKYNLRKLKMICEDNLIQNITIENCVKLLHLINDIGVNKQLEEKTKKFIETNVANLWSDSFWRQEVRDNMKLYEEIFKNALKK